MKKQSLQVRKTANMVYMTDNVFLLVHLLYIIYYTHIRFNLLWNERSQIKTHPDKLSGQNPHVKSKSPKCYF